MTSDTTPTPPHAPAAAERLDARALGEARLQARRARIGRIRKRAVGWSVAVFIAVWGAIFFQLVSGGDPGLASTTKHSTTAAAGSSTTSSSSNAGTSASGNSSSASGSSSGASSSTSGSSGSSSTSSPSAVTTSQS